MYHQIHIRMTLSGKKDETKDITYSKTLSWQSVRTEKEHENHILLVGFSSGIRID